MFMLPDLQHWRPNHWLNLWLTEVVLSRWTKRTLQQDAKSNNTAQYNDALRRRNHEKIQKKTLDISGDHIFRLKEGGKRCRWVTLGEKMT